MFLTFREKLGSFIASSASWTTFGTEFIPNNWAWRIPSILQGLPSVLQFFLVLWVPESPRWLVSKGHESRALQTLAYYHADGDETDPLVLYEFNEIKAGIELDRTGEFFSFILENACIQPIALQSLPTLAGNLCIGHPETGSA